MKTLKTTIYYFIISFSLSLNFNDAKACNYNASFSGDSMVCAGSSYNYLTKLTTGHYYRWVVTGGTIVSGQGKDSIWVNWHAPGSGSLQLYDSTSTSVSFTTKTIQISLTSVILTQAKYIQTGGLRIISPSGRTYTVTSLSGSGDNAVWNNYEINLDKNFDFSFITNQSAYSATPPGDGMMFVMQNAGGSVNPGLSGSSLGYYGASSGVMNESIGIEEDIFNSGSTYDDSSASHLNLVMDDSPTPLRPQVNISPKLSNGSNRKIRITWNRDANIFEVYFDGIKRYSWNNDIVKSIFGGNPNIWFGFTGSFGATEAATQTFTADTLIYNQAIINSSFPGDTICYGDTVTLTSSQGVSYLWSNGAKTRSIKIIKSGIYSVTVTDSFNCTSTAIDTVNLVILPQVSASFTVSNICAGEYVSLTNKTTPTTGVRYTWKFGNGYSLSGDSPIYSYLTAGNYMITLSVTNGGCTSMASTPITVYAHPSGITVSKEMPFQGQFNNGNAASPDYACLGDTITYQFSSPKGYSNLDYGSKWIISSKTFATASRTINSDTLYNNPMGSTNAYFKFFPSAKFADSILILTVHVQLIPGNCDTEIIRYIHVRPDANSKFRFTNACQGYPIFFYDSSTIAAGDSINNWNWNFGDGIKSTLQNPNHIYSKPGFYNVTLTATSNAGCGIPVSQSVNQYPNPIAAFHAATGCQNVSSVFTDSSTVGYDSTITNDYIVTYAWDFGNSALSHQGNPKYTYSKSGPYQVKLVITSFFGCKDSVTKSIRVEPLPMAAFSYKNACIGSSIDFANNSTDSASGTKYLWNFGDGHTSTSDVPSHNYAANGTYNVELVVTSIYGCTDTSIQKVTPYAETIPNILYSGTCLKNTTAFGDSDRNDIGASYSWNFGDGVSDVVSAGRISHTYKNAGTYKVLLTIQNGEGCVDTGSSTIVIYNYPVAAFYTSSICEGFPLIFDNLSAGTGLTYSWNFDDSASGKNNYSTLSSPVHTYDTAGSYSVMLTATNPGGCVNTITQKVNVEASPIVKPWSYKINGQTVTFTPQDTTQKLYEWYFGTGDNSSSIKPVYKYTANGKYDVKLVETNTAGCSGSYSDTITLTGLGVESVSGPANSLNISIFPNPFENNTVISYTLTDNSKVNISVYDIQGKLVAELKDGNFPAGKYEDEFDAAKYNAAEGLYLLKMAVNEEVFTGRIVEMK